MRYSVTKCIGASKMRRRWGGKVGEDTDRDVRKSAREEAKQDQIAASVEV